MIYRSRRPGLSLKNITMPAARQIRLAELHGLYRRGEWLGAPCYGVAWWIPPTRSAAAAWWLDPDEVLVLSRLVIIPGTPKNAATFLLMRSVKMLDPRWKCLLTYADTWQRAYRAHLPGGGMGILRDDCAGAHLSAKWAHGVEKGRTADQDA